MFGKILNAPAGERSLVLAILAFGALLRLSWIVRAQNLAPYLSESHHIAVSLVRNGTFADPFGAATGPTAHVGMLTPLPSVAAYWLFGVNTPAAEFALSAWAIAIVFLGLFLCWRLAGALGVPRIARLGAVAFAAVVPLQFKLELQEGRNWEVNLAVLMLLWILLRLVLADKKGSAGTGWLLVTGALAGLLFILSPPAGLASVMAIGLFQYLRLRPRQWWIAPAAFIAVAGLLAGVWTERNMARLGAPIALRDNLGLELAISNHDGAVHPADPFAGYISRMVAIHPIHSEAALEAMQAAGGEVPYYRQLGEKAEAWIFAHPAEFAALSVERFFQFYLPPRWFWEAYGRPGLIATLQQSLSWAAAIAGLGTLGFMAWSRRGYAYLLIATLACSAPYVIIQPTLRYRYLVSTLLIFLAFDGIARLAAYFTGRKAMARAEAGASVRY
jgi:hypothetical protein